MLQVEMQSFRWRCRAAVGDIMLQVVMYCRWRCSAAREDIVLQVEIC